MARNRELIVDSFSGGGGAGFGIREALGRDADVAIDRDPAALAMYGANHPQSRLLLEDVWKSDLRAAVGGRPVGLLWASPDCKHFSRAKVRQPVSKNVRSLAWVVVKWAVQVRPRIIILENVREFAEWGPLLKVGGELIPHPARKGQTFQRWVGRLREIGYRVERRNLNAADFGAPTHRRRLFVVARRDGEPIEWPEPTHCDPHRVDAPLLFGLAKKPWRTAAECIDWSLPCPSIFNRKKPLVEATMRRIALGMQRYVLDNPRPFIVPVTHSGDRRGELTVVSPTLIQVGYGEREGQSPRVPGIEKPLGTVVSGGAKHALAAAFLVKHFGGVVGTPIDSPLPTTTAIATQNQVAAVNLIHLNHGHKQWSSLDEPARTVTTHQHATLVYSSLVRYFGTAIGQHLTEPLYAITGKDRFELVLVKIGGEPYAIVDIGMRMLTPRELARAQGFPDDYVLTGSKTSQVARIGNSVPPAMARVLVEANLCGALA